MKNELKTIIIQPEYFAGKVKYSSKARIYLIFSNGALLTYTTKVQPGNGFEAITRALQLIQSEGFIDTTNQERLSLKYNVLVEPFKRVARKRGL